MKRFLYDIGPNYFEKKVGKLDRKRKGYMSKNI